MAVFWIIAPCSLVEATTQKTAIFKQRVSENKKIFGFTEDEINNLSCRTRNFTIYEAKVNSDPGLGLVQPIIFGPVLV
jgi:hypothetical protein